MTLIYINRTYCIGLWRGTAPSIYRTVPGTGLYFLLLNNVQALVSSIYDHISRVVIVSIITILCASSSFLKSKSTELKDPDLYFLIICDSIVLTHTYTTLYSIICIVTLLLKILR